MRVGVNVEQLLYASPGGVGRYTAELIRRLDMHDVTVKAFCAQHTDAEVAAAWSVFGLDGIELPVRSRLPRPALYQVWNIPGCKPPLSNVDLFHAPSLAVPPSGGKPLVVTVHDAAWKLYPHTFTRWGRFFHSAGLRRAMRSAARIITVSEAAADELVSQTGLARSVIRVVPNGVHHRRLSAGDRAESLGSLGLRNKRFILWVGSLEPRKDVGTLVSAVARLRTLHDSKLGGEPPVLVLAGYEGWLNSDLLNTDAVAKLGDDLIQLGRVGETELTALYEEASVFCFPSRHEGFGLPVLEAMAAGTPVIASDIPALREVTGDAAKLVPPGDVETWADTIAEVLSDEVLGEELVGLGLKRAALFSWSATAKMTAKVYAELI